MSCQGPDADLVSEVALVSGCFGSDAYRTFHFWHFGGRLWNSINVERTSSFNGDMSETMVVI